MLPIVRPLEMIWLSLVEPSQFELEVLASALRLFAAFSQMSMALSIKDFLKKNQRTP